MQQLTSLIVNMNSVTSSSISVNVDLQAVVNCLSGDMMMFASAMLAFAVLHHMKKVTLVKGEAKKPDKIASEQASIEVEAPVRPQTVTTHASAVPKVELPAASAKDNKQTNIERAREQQQQQPLDTNAQVALMRKYAAVGNIKQTLSIFRAIQKSSVPVNSTMYNTVMQAWIQCGNVWAAENVMDDIKEAKMADGKTFAILMKALVKVRDFDKAKCLLQDMQSSCVEKSAAPFDVLLTGFAREGRINDGALVLKEMEAAGVQPNITTREIIATLLNSARHFHQGLSCVRQIASACGHLSECRGQGVRLDFRDVPRLAFLISQCQDATSTACVHDVEIQGARTRLRAVQKTLKQQGFLQRADNDAFPLDGHWHTDHGLTVTIEGKVVRWSKERASRLCFAPGDRAKCELIVYGQPSTGHLVQPLVPFATRSLKWDNGDVWHSYDGRVIGGTTFFSQSMTKISRDCVQDRACQARAVAVLKSVSRQGLGLPSNLESVLSQYLGNDLYCLNVSFESTTVRPDVFATLSRRHPRVGLRHCWVRPGSNACGQRTLVNGAETDEECFNRHIRAVARA